MLEESNVKAADKYNTAISTETHGKGWRFREALELSAGRTLFSLESLHKAAGPFLGCHVERDARQLAVDVQSALELQEVPVLHDHLGFGS